DTQSGHGNTPLNEAAQMGYLDVVRYLVEKKDANIYIKNTYNNTPLDSACSKGHKDIVEYLNFQEKKHSETSRAIKTGFSVGVIATLTVTIGCIVTHISLSILVIAALIVGAIAGGMTYTVLKPSTKLNEYEVEGQSLPETDNILRVNAT
ncbi:MAG: ankyrin repeat domain-containing protein, partial [Wolbachia sp.]